MRDFATKLAASGALHLAIASNRGDRLATFDTRFKEAAAMRGVRVAALGENPGGRASIDARLHA